MAYQFILCCWQPKTPLNKHANQAIKGKTKKKGTDLFFCQKVLFKRTKNKSVPFFLDFLIMDGDKRVWIEVICPEPRGVSADWTQFSEGVTNFPHESILLRWTAAIKEKSEKLIGSPSAPDSGYLHSGIVAPDDAYVIAVNGVQLRNGSFSSHLGISQFPFALEAVFPVGPYQLTIDRDTHQVTDRKRGQIYFFAKKYYLKGRKINLSPFFRQNRAF